MDVLTKLRERSQRSYVPPLTLALVLIGLGRTDEAFEQLELAFAERSSWLVSLNVEPLFDSIRDDARFPLLAKRVGLPDRR